MSKYYKPKARQFTFFNNGTNFFFNPDKPLTLPDDDQTKTYLDLHLDLVRNARSASVFVLDSYGREVSPYKA